MCEVIHELHSVDWNLQRSDHWRGIYGEEKAKVVAAVEDRMYSTHCRAGYFAPGRYEEKDELHQGDMKKRMNSFYSSNRPGTKSLRSKEFNQFCPQNSNNDLCLIFCINPSYMDLTLCRFSEGSRVCKWCILNILYYLLPAL